MKQLLNKMIIIQIKTRMTRIIEVYDWHLLFLILATHPHPLSTPTVQNARKVLQPGPQHSNTTLQSFYSQIHRGSREKQRLVFFFLTLLCSF